MVAASNIGWGGYKSWEGPFWRGLHKYRIPARPSEEDKILAVITATEGGTFEAYNGYDGQGASLGLIQLKERGQYSVSALLGAVYRRDPELLNPLFEVLQPRGYGMKKNSRGRFRFFYRAEEVDTWEEQQRLFYANSTGEKGTWGEPNSANRQIACKLAAGISTVMENPVAQAEQVRFIVPILRKFAFGESARFLATVPQSDIGLAFTAAYLSYAVNNPVRANKHLQIALKSIRHAKWGMSWFIEVLKELTFGPQISIYPHRYNAIRPMLEMLYGIDLPDMATELATWKETTGHSFGFDPIEVQQALVLLGYDLGPKGVDGKWGQKSRDAMRSFEERHGVPMELQDGMPDPVSMAALSKELEGKGVIALK